MKAESVKTKPEFDDIYNNWYHRTNNIREIWQDENETQVRKMKALKLWIIMKDRILKLFQVAKIRSQPNPPT